MVAGFVKHLHGSTAHYVKQQMPAAVTGGDQVLMREATPWDKRQADRLVKTKDSLERGLKSANTPGVIAQFIAPVTLRNSAKWRVHFVLM